MRAFPAERRLLLEAFVVACVQKEKKRRGPTQTVTPVSDVLLVIGPAAMKTSAVGAQQDFIPIELNRPVVKFVKQVDTIQMKRVLK